MVNEIHTREAVYHRPIRPTRRAADYSAIDSNSIMFRSTADDLHKLGNLSKTAIESRQRRDRTKIDPNILKPNLAEPTRLRPPPAEASRSPSSGASLYSRLSGSIQNLFISGSRGQSGSTSTAVRSGFSKSENNLSELSRRRAQRNDRFMLFGSRGKVRQRRANNFLTSGGGSFFTYNYDDEEESRWKKYFSFGSMHLLRKHKAKAANETETKRYVTKS